MNEQQIIRITTMVVWIVRAKQLAESVYGVSIEGRAHEMGELFLNGLDPAQAVRAFGKKHNLVEMVPMEDVLGCGAPAN